MATLTVGQNQQFSTIAAALAAAHSGDTVDVSAGTYVNDLATAHANVNLVAVGGQVTMQDTQPMANGQALLTVTAGATITGFVFEGAHSADGTAAGLLASGGAVTVLNSLFTGNQNGLAAQGSGTTVLVQGSEFNGNGTGAATSGNIEAGAIQSLTIQGSYVHDAAGDETKSLAHTTTVASSRVMDNQAASAALLDLADGGTVSVTGSVLEKGSRSAAGAAIRFGGGTVYGNGSLSLSGNTIVSDRPGSLMLQNSTFAIASVASNQVYGFTAGPMTSGSVTLSGNTVATARPATSTTALVVPVAPAAPSYGRAGAVVADGTVLTVGAGGQFATLGAALAAAHDGDTIDVAAGTYAIKPTTISHKVIIQGVGGLAQFVAVAPPVAGPALITTTTDTTLVSVEISGAATPGTAEAAVLDLGGNLTIDSSTIVGNQAGVVARPTVAGTGAVGIYDSEIGGNGTPDGSGGNVQVGAVAAFVMQDDYVHDGLGAAEVTSTAAATVLDGDRVSQVAGDGAADVALPDGGQVSITNSAIEKGADSQVAPLIQVGGGPAYAGSAVTVANTTLISDLVAAPTTFVAAAPGSAVVTVTGATFVGGGARSTLVQNGTDNAAQTATGVMVNTARPWTGGVAAPSGTVPVTVAAPIGPAGSTGILVLDVSEDAYHGDAQFTVSVDGAPVGGTLTATAAHGAGQSEAFTIAGSFAPGPHAVQVSFVNNLAGAGAERNLYLDGAAFNSVAFGKSAAMMANGTVTMATGVVTRQTAVTVNLSEDAWHGDAEAFITIDGKVQDGLQTVTASHGAGQTEAMRFLLDLAPGAHTVGVTALNAVTAGGASRELHVDSIVVAGQIYPSAAATIASDATSTLAFTVAPPAAANASLFVTAGPAEQVGMLLPGH